MKNAAHHIFENSLMQDLCRYINMHSDQPLTLEQLAKQADMSPAHLQRRFKAVIGISPKEYMDSCRLKKLKTGLRANVSVTHAIYDAGFASSSRIYERVNTRLGMTPKQYRDLGKDIVISYAAVDTKLGQVMMGATDRGLCFIQFGNSAVELLEQLGQEYPKAVIMPMDDTHKDQFDAWMRSLSDYLSGNIATPDLPLDIRGTAFQIKVWKYLQTIPAGQVQSYKQVAEAIGKPKAIRAVASACANNNIAIAIPCHRVIRGNGELAGYRWGLKRKRALIELECRNMDHFIHANG